MPSKALLRPGEVLAAVQRVPGARSAVTGGIDAAETLKRRDAAASNYDDTGQVKWLESVNVDLVRGRGRLAGERRVEVEGSDGAVRTLSARVAVVLATGSTAAMPPIDGLQDAEPWDSRKATAAKEVPESLLVLGGGPVGVRDGPGVADPGRGGGDGRRVRRPPHPQGEPFASRLVAESFGKLGIRHLHGHHHGQRTAQRARYCHLQNGTDLSAQELLGGRRTQARHRRRRRRDRGAEPGRLSASTTSSRAVDVPAAGSTPSATSTGVTR